MCAPLPSARVVQQSSRHLFSKMGLKLLHLAGKCNGLVAMAENNLLFNHRKYICNLVKKPNAFWVALICKGGPQ